MGNNSIFYTFSNSIPITFRPLNLLSTNNVNTAAYFQHVVCSPAIYYVYVVTQIFLLTRRFYIFFFPRPSERARREFSIRPSRHKDVIDLKVRNGRGRADDARPATDVQTVFTTIFEKHAGREGGQMWISEE